MPIFARLLCKNINLDGYGGFAANKVAEKAGVNIASFYQYFSNKESLLFHIVRQTWDRQLARLTPILTRSGEDHADKLHHFIREFFLIEAVEVDLRRALRAASVDLRETDAFRGLFAAGADLMRRFVGAALRDRASTDLDFVVRFICLLTTSFAERTTDEGTTGDDLMRQADRLTDMLVARFDIS